MAEETNGNVFLDVLDRVANWDILRRGGMPNALDGGAPAPRPASAPVRTEQTPPAPPGGVSALPASGTIMGVDQKTVMLGLAAFAGAALLVAAFK
ncbi:MAG TPA: hypothetical protein ENJ79_07820 [Gammaproteobacteria bacterium]|nr:hypothetical protein [Gammaproteobacteria bacterium]